MRSIVCRMEKRTQFNVGYLVIAIIAMFLIQNLWIQMHTVQPISYSEFQTYLKEGRINEINVLPNYIEGTLKTPLPDGRSRFIAVRVDPELARDLAPYNVKFSGVVQSTFLRELLSWIVPATVFILIWFYVIRRIAEKQGLGGGFLTIGKSKAKVYVESDIRVTFDDVAGVDEAKEELKEVVGFLRDPQRYGRLGGRVPKGVLLVGPPGTGKTLLARALAGEAAVPFLSINGSEFVEMFVGVGAARVRDLFEQARAKAPCIIFIDELDALGRARGAYGIGGHDEKEQTLNQLLSEMDGFDPSSGVVLLAATNRPEILDPALLRAGRFDRQILVARPDKQGRADILRLHLRKVRLQPDVDAQRIAALTPGFSGADLANLVNEAALLATRRGAEAVAPEDFTAAVERIIAGLEKKTRILNETERKIVAYHEMGHALVAMSLPGTDPVHKISIIPHGIGALGYTMQRPTEDRFLMTRGELENRMATLLGGRAAEMLVFGYISTGAADDLVKVTDIARSMATRFGMVDTLGQIAYEPERAHFLAAAGAAFREREFSEQTAREIDCAVRDIVKNAFSTAMAIVTEKRATLEQGAQWLLQKETLNEADLATLQQQRATLAAMSALLRE